MRSALLAAALLGSTTATAPNVVFVLTDDQDWTLGSMDTMNRTMSLLGGSGVIFDNHFVSTPICCPSRAEIITGRHMHNTKVTGNACGGVNFKDNQEKLNVAHYAKTIGNYTTFYAGKYLNNYGSGTTGGVAYIPPGWDQWYGLVGNSKYYGYTVSNNGIAEKHGHDYYSDYFTDYLANKSVEFIRKVGGGPQPFFVMLGTPSCHIPDDYAPWTEQLFNTSKAPRTGNWNLAPQPNKHPMMQGIQPMAVGNPAVDKKTDVFGSDWVAVKRLRTLQSVDVMVERLVDAVTETGELENTYFLYSSDNGYHLGQFGLGYDKRQPYEEDIRVPLLARGPGLTAGSRSSLPVMNVDLAPTILDMMGIDATIEAPQMDGRSWLPVVTGSTLPQRTELLIEYNGPVMENERSSISMESARSLDQLEVDVDPDTGLEFDMFADSGNEQCKWFSKESTSACDPGTNTYACVRSIKSTRVPGEVNSLYCEFTKVSDAQNSDVNGGNYIEYYDLDADPWQLNNLAVNESCRGDADFRARLAKLAARLRGHMSCAGADCLDPEDGPLPAPTPSPSPAAVVRFRHEDATGTTCLALGTGSKNKFDLALAPCGTAVDVWVPGLDGKGRPQILAEAVTGTRTCLNILGGSCKTGKTVHAGPCQDDVPDKDRVANHFHWDSKMSTISSDHCPGLCVDFDDGNAIVAECDGIAGWSKMSISRFEMLV